MIKSTILIGGNYLFNYITQSNYCIIEIFNCSFSFLKNNIEIKDGCKFDKSIRKNFWEYQYAFKYVHQRLIIVNKDYIVNKEDIGWYGRANFGGNSFDSVHLIPL